MKYASLVGWGHYAPENVVTNDDLAKFVDTSDEWIRSRSGIERRHFVSPDQATSDLSIEAGRRALDRAGVDPEAVDLVIVATSSPDYLTPPVSSQIQHALGCTNAGAFTMMVGCTGFVYGLVTADQFIRTGAYETILVIGAEVISKNLDFEDRTTCVLFGDGAGAVVLQASDEPCGVQAFELGSDGSQAEALIAPCPGTRNPVSQEAIDNRTHYLRMDGRAVFKFATRTMAESIQRVMAKADAEVADVDLFIPHQANARIIEYAAKTLGLPPEKVVMNVADYGNTSAATIPIALSETLDAGRAKPGDTLALVGFGAGLTWAACLFDLGPLALAPADAEADREHSGDGTPDSVIDDRGVVSGLIA
ncbi:beta-ketoacyl-ACP synthase III [Rubrivirga sp. IMCC43871]|uniref:beta-ketoacyl-ACP synthase III n=1 Tax=Rubrivirga sp. IMCC43871 TaxID=3391575 RepID=UPI00398FBD24